MKDTIQNIEAYETKKFWKFYSYIWGSLNIIDCLIDLTSPLARFPFQLPSLTLPSGTVSLTFPIQFLLWALFSLASECNSCLLILAVSFKFLMETVQFLQTREYCSVAVPSLFSTRDWFHRRQFFHGPEWEGWFQDDSSVRNSSSPPAMQPGS